MADASAADLAEQAESLIAEEHFEDAVDVAWRLVSQYPGAPTGHLLMARLLEEAESFEQAEEHAVKATEVDPSHAPAYLFLAKLRNNIEGRSEDAEAAARRAIELDPGDWNVHSELATALRAQRRWADSEEPQRAVLALAPNKVGPRMQLAMLLTRLARPEEAAVEFDIAFAAGIGTSSLESGLSSMESCGLAPALKEIYIRFSEAIDRPDLSEPGTAGDDPELLAEQAKIAYRMSAPVGQEPAISKAALERAAALAHAVLAVDPENETALEALERVDGSTGMPNIVHTDPDRALQMAAEFRALSKRFNEIAQDIDADRPDTLVVFLQAMNDGHTLRAKYGVTYGEEKYPEIVETELGALRRMLADKPDSRQELAAKLSAAGLATAFPEFHYWLLTGPAGDVGARLGDVETTDVAETDEDLEGGKLS